MRIGMMRGLLAATVAMASAGFLERGKPANIGAVRGGKSVNSRYIGGHKPRATAMDPRLTRLRKGWDEEAYRAAATRRAERGAKRAVAYGRTWANYHPRHKTLPDWAVRNAFLDA